VLFGFSAFSFHLGLILIIFTLFVIHRSHLSVLKHLSFRVRVMVRVRVRVRVRVGFWG